MTDAVTMQNNEVIRVENLTKQFRWETFGREHFLKSKLSLSWRALRRKSLPLDLDKAVLKELNFSVFRGETVGILGKSGSGKSTLLRIIADVLRPSAGRVLVAGRLFPMLQLGAGFHGDLTGEDNIRMCTSVLGIPRRLVRERWNDIVEFSELGRSLQEPVKRYSHGMVFKLGFSIASHLPGQVLLMDESFEVSDAAFREKCFDRIAQMTDEGSSVLLASHDPEKIRRICRRSILLGEGKISCDSTTDHTLAVYSESIGRK